MKRGGVIFLLIFVIFIMFLNWYFLFKNPCEPTTICSVKNMNISCASQSDCNQGSVYGNCNQNTFKCVNLVLEGDKEDCLGFGGEWIETGCAKVAKMKIFPQ